MMKGIPAGAPVVTPRLFCRDPDAEVDFCVSVFGAVEGVRRPGADGRTSHAVVTLGPAMVMIESEWPQSTNRAPRADGSSPVALYIYLETVDDTVARAVAAGATLLMPLADQFWGDRTAWIMDPEGHVWTVASRIEDTTEDQRQQRLARLLNTSETSDGTKVATGEPNPPVATRASHDAWRYGCRVS